MTATGTGWRRSHWDKLRGIINGELPRLLEPLKEENWNPGTKRKAGQLLSSWLNSRMRGDLGAQFPPYPEDHVWFVSLDFFEGRMSLHLYHRQANPGHRRK